MTELTTDQINALRKFARDNGHQWKSKLNEAWMNGSDAYEPDGCYLRQVRNSFGPSWLVRNGNRVIRKVR